MNWSENTATELDTTKNTSLFFEEIADSASVSCPYSLLVSYLDSFDLTQTWFLSLIGSSLVGLCGILPLLIIPLDYTVNNKTESIRELNYYT